MKLLQAGLLSVALQAGALHDAAAQAPLPLRADLYASLRAQSIDSAPALRVDPQPVRHSPGVLRFAGGFVTGTATLVGLMAATWNDPEAVSEPVIFGAYAVGTALGASLTTAIWEKPNSGLWIGAAVGALPLLAAMNTDDDDAAGSAILVAWFSAPLGAAIGQALKRKPAGEAAGLVEVSPQSQ